MRCYLPRRVAHHIFAAAVAILKFQLGDELWKFGPVGAAHMEETAVAHNHSDGIVALAYLAGHVERVVFHFLSVISRSGCQLLTTNGLAVDMQLVNTESADI